VRTTGENAGRLADPFGERTFVVLGLLLQSIAMGWIAVVAGTDTAHLEILPALVVGGVGLTMAMPVAQKAVVGAVQPRVHGHRHARRARRAGHAAGCRPRGKRGNTG